MEGPGIGPFVCFGGHFLSLLLAVSSGFRDWMLGTRKLSNNASKSSKSSNHFFSFIKILHFFSERMTKEHVLMFKKKKHITLYASNFSNKVISTNQMSERSE